MADDKNEVKDTNDKDEEMKEESIETKASEDEEDVKDSPAKSKAKEDETEKKTNNNVDTKSEEEDGNESKEEDEDDDEDEEGEKEELPPGLLEQPLEVEGKRQKKKVERLSAAMIRSSPEKPQLEIEEGSGTKLGEIPIVAHYINVTKAADLKPLHKFLFLRVGTLNDTKKNIRKFSGTTEAKDSKEREKRLMIGNKFSNMELKNICMWLGLKQAGTKSDLMERVISFLEKPEDQGIEPKKRGSKSKTPAKKGAKRKRKSTDKKEKPKKKKQVKKSKNKVEEEEDEDEEDEPEEEQEEEEDEEEHEEEEEDESEDEAPKKKKRKVEVKKKVVKKVTPKKAAKENGKKEKASSKKEKSTPKKEKASPKKKPTPKKKPAAEELSDLSGDDSDSDEEPLAKTAKPPSDDEIKKAVKSILDGADLETVTMKTVVKQVYAKYPKFDLSDRKDFIKGAVREVIS